MSNESEKDPILTWGERMAQAVRHLATLRLPNFPWLVALDQVRKRAQSSASQAPARFRRVEVTRMAEPKRPPPDFSEVELPDDEGLPLGTDLRERLRATLGADPGPARIHTDDGADTLARRHRADAVTVGQDIYFREGRFQPREPRGFALLAHEASHLLAAIQPNAGSHRSTAAGVRQEERAALRLESNALAKAVGTPAVERTIRSPVVADRLPLAAPSQAPVSPVSRPMTAAANRGFEDSPGGNAGVDVDGIKRAIYADLMRQLRTDFERGG